MSEASAAAAPKVPAGAAGCGRRALLGRLLLVAIWLGATIGVADVLLHARDLSPAEATAAVGIYALFAAVGVLAATPLLLLLLALPPVRVRPGRPVLAVAWSGAVATALLLPELGRFTIVHAAVLIAGASALTLRAWQADRFATTAPWRLRWGATLVLAIGLAAAPPLLERADHVAAAALPPRDAGRPDLVLIVLDTQRADFLGAYGHAGGLSPAFDAFAAAGRLYARCHSPAPWTVPAHASLFTGHFPKSHGASFEHHRWLDARFTTLAEALRDQGGYQTAAFVANDYLEETQLLQGFDVVRPLGDAGRRLALQPLFELLGWPARRADHGAAEAVTAIGRFLERERDGDRPLFLFVNLMEAHWRFLPALRERLAQTGGAAPGVVPATLASSRYYGPTLMARGAAPPATVASIRALYAAAVQYQDRALGQLLDQVDARLGRERTLVAITADHGENLGDGGRFDHVFALNDVLLHVPLAIRWPQGIRAGGTEPGLCQLVDVAPTLLAAAKIDAMALGEECAGRSLLPEGFAPREVVLGFGDPYLGHLERVTAARGLNRDVVDLAAVLRSISDGRFKLLRRLQHGVVREQFFRLGDAGDAAETQDLSASEPAERARLSARLDVELQALPAYSGPPFAPPEDADAPAFDAEGLSGLGYANGR
ncbi:MAG: sulfatase [Planctomycetes bacterium]|nr:sulfatase [Planctomycetota bacterium]